MSNVGYRLIGGAVLASAKDADTSLRLNSNCKAGVGENEATCASDELLVWRKNV